MKLNRRADDRINRLSRITVTGTLGAPLAILMVAALDHYGVRFSSEVVAAFGAVIGAPSWLVSTMY